MNREVTYVPLAELCDQERGITYGIVKIGEFVPGGVPVIRGGDIRNGSIVFDDQKRVTEEISQQFQRTILRGGEIVINLISEPGHNAIVPLHLAGANVSRDVGVIPLNDTVDHRYVDYYLKSPMTVNWLTSRLQGSVTLKINLGTLKELPVATPSLGEQRAISNTLSLLDDRIFLLRETNCTLEAIAQALFKSWFVDFDPVRAKQEGREPEGIDSDTAALFPDSFEESDLGLVPSGWRAANFGDIITRLSVGKKYDNKTALPEGNVPILDQGKSGIIGFHNDTPSVKASLDAPIVVFANHTCYMRLISYDFSAIQNVLPFVGNKVDTVWAYYATKDRVKFSEYKGHWPDFAIEKAIIPNEATTIAFRNTTDPLTRRIRLNELQAQTLATLRDSLLPRLISGQLRLPDAEALIEEAAA